MKWSHKIIFIIMLIIVCLSAYSLADINKPYDIEFMTYENDDSFKKSSHSSDAKLGIMDFSTCDFDIITNNDKILVINKSDIIKNIEIPKIDFEKDFLIFCSLGKKSDDPKDIHITKVLQRGNIIDVIVATKEGLDENDVVESDFSYEFIKIMRQDIPIKGKILFIFKNSEGMEIFRKELHI